MKKVWIWVISALGVLICLFILRLVIVNISYTSDPPCLWGSNSYVTNVIDGSTFELDCLEDKFKLSCVNTPEEGEEGYEESKSFLQSLILDEHIDMPSDMNDRDEEGRILRWVMVENENSRQIIFVNKYMIEQGYGKLQVTPTENCDVITNVPSIRANVPVECMTSPLMVERVIDGDTFVLCSGDIVRLLCVDTPEKGKEGYEEATNFLSDLILYKEVTLTTSNYQGNNTDKYGRLLRWVYIANVTSGEKIFVNKEIFDQGYGELMIIPPETCEEITG
jgi:endonuclease YncB( thermonuclease family)